MKDKLVKLITVGFSKCTKPHECYAQLDLEALRAMLDEEMAKLLYGLGYEAHELAINLTRFLRWLKRERGNNG